MVRYMAPEVLRRQIELNDSSHGCTRSQIKLNRRSVHRRRKSARIMSLISV